MWSNSASTEDISGLVDGVYMVTVTDGAGCIITTSETITSPSGMTVTTSSTDAACGAMNGSATSSISGGTAPYTYLWDDPATQTNATTT